MTLKSFQGLCGSGVAKFSRFALAHLVIPLPFHNMQQNGCCMGLKYLHEKLGRSCEALQSKFRGWILPEQRAVPDVLAHGSEGVMAGLAHDSEFGAPFRNACVANPALKLCPA